MNQSSIKLLAILLSAFFFQQAFAGIPFSEYAITDMPLIVHNCADFTITGNGDNAAWQKTAWVALNKIDSGGKGYKTDFKILYSSTGIYVLFHGDDDKISSHFKHDFENLFEADVFEVFFHPEPAQTIYLEYEINALEKELVLLIPNLNGKFSGWAPWHYEGKSKVIKKVSIEGGKKKPNASVKGWSAEMFFPYALFNPLKNMPPKPGMRWNANFCRLDYDSGKMIKWSWSPVEVSFHEFRKYLSIQFE